jgi:hypothetical protein
MNPGDGERVSMTKTLHDRYLDYLGFQVVTNKALEDHRDLFEIMHSMEFVWIVPNDDNRIADGLDVRIEWMADREASGLQGPVSFLEMLVGLSRRAEFLRDEMTAKQWAWHLICNIELNQMWDPLSQRKRQKCIDTLERVIWRTYKRNGSGGLFPLHRPQHDQRKVELWYQLNAYVMENYPL